MPGRLWKQRHFHDLAVIMHTAVQGPLSTQGAKQAYKTGRIYYTGASGGETLMGTDTNIKGREQTYCKGEK